MLGSNNSRCTRCRYAYALMLRRFAQRVTSTSWSSHSLVTNCNARILYCTITKMEASYWPLPYLQSEPEYGTMLSYVSWCRTKGFHRLIEKWSVLYLVFYISPYLNILYPNSMNSSLSRPTTQNGNSQFTPTYRSLDGKLPSSSLELMPINCAKLWNLKINVGVLWKHERFLIIWTSFDTQLGQISYDHKLNDGLLIKRAIVTRR